MFNYISCSTIYISKCIHLCINLSNFKGAIGKINESLFEGYLLEMIPSAMSEWDALWAIPVDSEHSPLWTNQGFSSAIGSGNQSYLSITGGWTNNTSGGRDGAERKGTLFCLVSKSCFHRLFLLWNATYSRFNLLLLTATGVGPHSHTEASGMFYISPSLSSAGGSRGRQWK